jgi:formylglycine-generating enzyme required for sulfatase activity
MFGWFHENSNSSTQPIGRLRANELGIHDMSGNVFEWTADMRGGFGAADTVINPTGARSHPNRVNRGGAWMTRADFCRVSSRHEASSANPSIHFGTHRAAYGFRVIFD